MAEKLLCRVGALLDGPRKPLDRSASLGTKRSSDECFLPWNRRPCMRKRIVFFSQTGGMADFGGVGVPAFHGAHISRALARSRCQHGFVRSVRFSFPCGFRVGSGDSDFLGTARAA